MPKKCTPTVPQSLFFGGGQNSAEFSILSGRIRNYWFVTMRSPVFDTLCALFFCEEGGFGKRKKNCIIPFAMQLVVHLMLNPNQLEQRCITNQIYPKTFRASNQTDPSSYKFRVHIWFGLNLSTIQIPSTESS